MIGGVEDWDVDDPAGQPLEKVREIRDDIERLVRELIEVRADEIRSDRSGHDRRLAQLLPSLIDDFGALGCVPFSANARSSPATPTSDAAS